MRFEEFQKLTPYEQEVIQLLTQIKLSLTNIEKVGEE